MSNPIAMELDESILPKLRADPVLYSKKIVKVYPHWYQEEILQNDSKQIAIRMSRQLGKTFIMAVKVLWEAMTRPQNILPSEEYVVMIIAPAQRQSRIMFRQIKTFIDRNPIIAQSVTKDIQTEIRFSNNSVIYNFPVGDDASKVRGYSVHSLIADEAAFIPDAVFDALEPSLAATDGTITLISTPDPKGNYFYEAIKTGLEYDEYLERKSKGLTGITIKDDEGNLIRKGLYDFNGQYVTHWYPYSVGLEAVRKDSKGKPTGRTQLSERVISRARKMKHPLIFAQEYEAVFVDDSAMYFPLELLANSSQQYPPKREPTAGAQYFMGVDFAKHQDYYVAVVLEKMPNEPMRVVYWQQSKQRDYSFTVPRTAQIAKKFGANTLYADATGVGEPNVEKLRAMLRGTTKVEGITFSSKTKNEMYANLYEALGSDKLVLPAVNDELMNQMQAVMFEKMPSGTMKIEARSGSHDDYPDALALASMCITKPRFEVFFGEVDNITSKPKPRTYDTPEINNQEVQNPMELRFIGKDNNSDSRVIRHPITKKPMGLLPWHKDNKKRKRRW